MLCDFDVQLERERRVLVARDGLAQRGGVNDQGRGVFTKESLDGFGDGEIERLAREPTHFPMGRRGALEVTADQAARAGYPRERHGSINQPLRQVGVGVDAAIAEGWPVSAREIHL